MPIYKKKNENFFKTWSPQMAYVLGFVVADGSLTKNKRGAHFIEITSTDKAIIYSIRTVLGSDLRIGEYQAKNPRCKRRYKLQIGSKEMFQDLGKLGVVPRKSLTIRLPPVPTDLFSSFLRGYFDGDGCVSVCTYYRKDRGKLTTVINSGFTSGSKDLLVGTKNKLAVSGVVRGGTLYYHSRAYHLNFSIRDSHRLYLYMYSNLSSGLFLARKRDIFEKYFKEYSIVL